MAGPTGLVVLFLLVIGTFIRCLMHFRHNRKERHSDAEKCADVVAGEVKLQLYRELDQAIERSSIGSPKHDSKPANPSYTVFDSATRAGVHHHQYQREADLVEMQSKTDLHALATPEVAASKARGQSRYIASSVNLAGFEKLPPAQQSRDMTLSPAHLEDSPLFVNPKQFHRILKRRAARQMLEEALRLNAKLTGRSIGRKPSSNGCIRRARGPGGRFLTADQIKQMEAPTLAGEHADRPKLKRKAEN